MKTLKFIVLLTVMLVNVTPYIKDGKVEWKGNEAAAQYYTVEYDAETFTYYCHNFDSDDPAVYLFKGLVQCEAINNTYQHYIIKYYDNAMNILWENSFDENHNVKTECGAVIIEGGIQIQDARNNKFDETVYDLYFYRGKVGAYTLLPDGKYVQIKGTIHTHAVSRLQGGQSKPSEEDWVTLAKIGGNSPEYRTVIKSKIIAEDGIYCYWYEMDGTKSYVDPKGKIHTNQ